MAFTFDAATTAAGDITTGITTAHTCHATAKLLVVCLAMRTNTTSAVTYGGQALTLAESHFFTGDEEKVDIWYKVNPLTGANNVVSTIGASALHSYIVSSWISSGTPVLDVTGQNAHGSGDAAADPNVSLAGSVGTLAIDCLSSEENGTAGAIWTPGGDQTQLGEDASSSSWTVVASYELNPTASETFNYTPTGGGGPSDQMWTHIVASFKEAGGPSQRFMWTP